jgi:hypothetical protein
LPIAEERCLVDEDSYEPAFEGAFGGESWRVAGGGSATVFDCLIGFFSTVEDAECDELEQFAAAGKLLFEGGVDVFAGFAVGLEEAAAGSGKVDSTDALPGDGKFRGGGCHKHNSVLQVVYLGYAARLRLHTRFLQLLYSMDVNQRAGMTAIR